MDKKIDKTGRGVKSNTDNPFLKNRLVTEFPEGLDEPLEEARRLTNIHTEFPKTVVNRVDSPDVPLNWSLNPYQGCEHGCVYCYARNSHTYWGYSAGLDFEQEIMAKPNAPDLLRKYLGRKGYVPEAISLSGNTDCYQPAERKLQITRRLLEVFLEYRHPVGLITKNSLILRDLDLLRELASYQLCGVMISITTLDEELRRKLEPRTPSVKNRLKTIETLNAAGIPAGVMAAPVIPGLTSHELPAILKAAADAGAVNAGYTLLRLNGQVAELFSEWIRTEYPDRADKVLNQTAEVHGGKLNDSRFGTRMKGQGPWADVVRQLFEQAKKQHFNGRKMPGFNCDLFRVPSDSNGQGKLF
ncbi:MAG: PA0069 family radical SAM protein [Bacteroidetes bacterium]|nr:PA0069 family radical SAM protein [Bacteroidota bacterium]